MRVRERGGFVRWDSMPSPMTGGMVVVVIACQMWLGVGCGSTVSDRNLQFVTAPQAQDLAGRSRLLGDHATRVAWVDPRLDHEFRAGHIPGAFNVALDEARPRLSELRAYDTVIVYGTGKDGRLVQAMSKTLIGLGLDDVRTLRGGLDEWREAGFDVADGAGSRR